MKAVSKKIDLRIIAGYLLGVLLAWSIMPLVVTLRAPTDDIEVSFGRAISDAVMHVYILIGFLALAIMTSAFGWYKSQKEPSRKTFSWVFAISLVALAIFLIISVSP